MQRLDMLEDEFEGSTPPSQALERDDTIREQVLSNYMQQCISEVGEENASARYKENLSIWMDIIDRMHGQVKEGRKLFFINCWTMNNHESDALWKLYCKSGEGVVIQTTYSKLIASISHDPYLYIGKVTYIDYKHDRMAGLATHYASMHKTKPYEFENEIRLSKIHASFSDTNLILDWNILDNLESIRVAPNATSEFYQLIGECIQQQAPHLLTLFKPSDMTIPVTY